MPASFPQEAVIVDPADPYLLDDFERADENPIGGLWSPVSGYDPFQIVDGKLRPTGSSYCSMIHDEPLGPDPWWMAVKVEEWPNEQNDLYFEFCKSNPASDGKVMGTAIAPGEWWGHIPDDQLSIDLYAQPYEGPNASSYVAADPSLDTWTPGDWLVLVFDGEVMSAWTGQGEEWVIHRLSLENANDQTWDGQIGYPCLSVGPGESGDTSVIVIDAIRVGHGLPWFSS